MPVRPFFRVPGIVKLLFAEVAALAGSTCMEIAVSELRHAQCYSAALVWFHICSCSCRAPPIRSSSFCPVPCSTLAQQCKCIKRCNENEQLPRTLQDLVTDWIATITVLESALSNSYKVAYTVILFTGTLCFIVSAGYRLRNALKIRQHMHTLLEEQAFSHDDMRVQEKKYEWELKQSQRGSYGFSILRVLRALFTLEPTASPCRANRVLSHDHDRSDGRCVVPRRTPIA